jgi:hypothetical protein
MGKMNKFFPVTGSFGQLTVYKRHDIDDLIVRYKGGPSKHKFQTEPKLETTRRNATEFGGRSALVSWLLHSLIWIRHLANYNIAGALNSRVRPAQHLDTENEHGQRSVLLSKCPEILAGFDMNRKYPFDTIIRNPVKHTLDRATLTGSIEIPVLRPGINFHAPGNHPMFGFVFTLGVVPDVFHTVYGYNSIKKVGGEENITPTVVYSEWYPVLNGCSATTLNIQIDRTFPDEGYSLVLAIGIRFGTIGANGSIEQVPRAGAAKIIAAI